MPASHFPFPCPSPGQQRQAPVPPNSKTPKTGPPRPLHSSPPRTAVPCQGKSMFVARNSSSSLSVMHMVPVGPWCLIVKRTGPGWESVKDASCTL